MLSPGLYNLVGHFTHLWLWLLLDILSVFFHYFLVFFVADYTLERFWTEFLIVLFASVKRFKVSIVIFMSAFPML